MTFCYVNKGNRRRSALVTLAFLLTFVASPELNAQKLTLKQEAGIKKTVTSQFGELNNLGNLDCGRSAFCTIGKETYYNPDGFHFLFRLRGDTLERIDNCVFHGANFSRYLFTWNDKIYALGGYGFFTTNNNLEYFNTQTREWSFEPTTGDIPPFVMGSMLRTEHYLYSFNNMKGGNGAAEDIADQDIYRLNLETMSWKRFANNNPEISHLVKARHYYLRDYTFFLSSPYSILVREKDLKYIRISAEQLGMVGLGDDIVLDSNKLSCTAPGRGPGNSRSIQLDFDSIWAESGSEAQPFVLEPGKDEKRETGNITWMAIGGALIFGTTGILIYRKRKRKAPAETKENGESELFRKLRVQTKRLLTVEELDELLGITHLETDSKKLKRHRLLSDLEIKHPGVIAREKDEADKRRYLYRISISQ